MSNYVKVKFIGNRHDSIFPIEDITVGKEYEALEFERDGRTMRVVIDEVGDVNFAASDDADGVWEYA